MFMFCFSLTLLFFGLNEDEEVEFNVQFGSSNDFEQIDFESFFYSFIFFGYANKETKNIFGWKLGRSQWNQSTMFNRKSKKRFEKFTWLFIASFLFIMHTLTYALTRSFGWNLITFSLLPTFFVPASLLFWSRSSFISFVPRSTLAMVNNFIFEAFSLSTNTWTMSLSFAKEIHAECRSEFIMLPYLYLAHSLSFSLPPSMCHSPLKTEAQRYKILKVYRRRLKNPRWKVKKHKKRAFALPSSSSKEKKINFSQTNLFDKENELKTRWNI